MRSSLEPKAVAFFVVSLLAVSILTAIPIKTQATSGMTYPSNTTLATLSPTQCPASQAIAGSKTTFSLFWITDTQFLSDSNPGLFKNATQWIAKYYSACNGRMVIHTGDIVEHPPSVGGQTCNETDDYGSEWASDHQ